MAFYYFPLFLPVRGFCLLVADSWAIVVVEPVPRVRTGWPIFEEPSTMSYRKDRKEEKATPHDQSKIRAGWSLESDWCMVASNWIYMTCLNMIAVQSSSGGRAPECTYLGTFKHYRNKKAQVIFHTSNIGVNIVCNLPRLPLRVVFTTKYIFGINRMYVFFHLW